MKITKQQLKQIIKEEIEVLIEDFDSAGWPSNPPEHPEGSSGVCIQHTRSGTKKFYKEDDPKGYEKCLQSKAEKSNEGIEKEFSGEPQQLNESMAKIMQLLPQILELVELLPKLKEVAVSFTGEEEGGAPATSIPDVSPASE
tara:strand:- start:10609 stop:11034 length:426 start_codon:yes stop_codon:yes gene_type:complete